MNCMLSTGKMRDRVFWNQRVKQLVAKLLVATTAIVIAVVVFRWGLLAGIQSLFQLDESTVTVIRRMGLFWCVVLTYWAYQGVEKGTHSFGFCRPKRKFFGLTPAFCLVTGF